jgi:hypothetical protein
MNEMKKCLSVANLFEQNISVLNYLENRKDIKTKILDDLFFKNITREKTFPIINQSIFISFAYMVFVWLYEIICKKGGNKNLIEKYLKKNEIFIKTNSNILKDALRDTKNPKEYLRTIRNAISHGSVIINFEVNSFYFKDQNDRDRHDSAQIELQLEELGKLTMDLFYLYNKIVYNLKIE